MPEDILTIHPPSRGGEGREWLLIDTPHPEEKAGKMEVWSSYNEIISQMDALRKDNQWYTNRLGMIESQLRDRESLLRETKRNLHVAQQENGLIEREKDRLKNENTLLEREMVRLKNENTLLEREMAQLKEENTILGREMARLNEEIDGLQEKFNTEITYWEGLFSASEMADLRRENRKLLRQVKTLEEAEAFVSRKR